MFKSIMEISAHIIPSVTIVLLSHNAIQDQAVSSKKLEATKQVEAAQVGTAQAEKQKQDQQAPPEQDAPVGPEIGDMVLVDHYVTVFSTRSEDFEDLPTISTTIGYVYENEPDIVLAMTRWPGSDDGEPGFHSFKKIRDELVVAIRIIDFDDDGTP